MSLAYVVMRTDAPTNAPDTVFTTLEALRAYIGTDATPGTSASSQAAVLQGKMKNKSYKDNTEFDAEQPFTVYTVLLDPPPPAPKISFSGGRKKTARRRRRTTRKH